MNLVEKKEHILRCTRLGMDFFSAALIAECTEKELNVLDNDESFQRRLLIEHAIEEERLLEKHNSAMTLAADRGSATSIQWKLERLNPRRWGSKETGKIQVEPNMTINLIGRFPDGKDC